MKLSIAEISFALDKQIPSIQERTVIQTGYGPLVLDRLGAATIRKLLETYYQKLLREAQEGGQ